MNTPAVDLPRKPRLEVLGVRVLGPPPIEDVYFDLSPGFTALYGLNGAGKSRLLAAVADILAGRRNGDGYVIVRLSRAQDPKLAFFYELDRAARRRFPADRPAFMMGRIVGEMMGDPDREDDDIFAVSRCVAEQRYWMLQPAGDRDGWYAVPGFMDDGTLRSAVDLDQQTIAVLSGEVSTDPNSALKVLLGQPLFASGPAAAAARREEPDRLRVEGAALGECVRRPYPLIDFDHPKAYHLGDSIRFAEVVTNRDLSPERVRRESAELIDGYLSTMEYPSLAECRASLARQRDGAAADRSDFLAGIRLARGVAEGMSKSATSVLTAALPGRLDVRCQIGLVEGELNEGVNWVVSGEQHNGTLRLTELSDAQTRWACLSISYALSVQRQELVREGLRDSIYEHLVAQREENGDEDYTDERSAVASELHELRNIRRARAVGKGRILSLGPNDSSSFPDSAFEPDFDELYDDDTLMAGVPEYWSDEQLDEEIDRLEDRLDELGPADEPDEPNEPTYEEIEAELDALLQRDPLDPIYLFLDEPEAGLHRSAERQVVSLLRRIATQQRLPVTVATHSPAFLEPGGANPILVSRDHGGPTMLDTAPGVLNRTATSLGISALERLSLYRSFLLVEGRHDEIVLEEFFKDELLRHRVLVVPLHGGRLMPHAADALLIADFTEHRVFAMVDNSDQHVFDRLVDAARTLTPGDGQAFELVSKDILAGEKRDEHVFISRLIRRAFEEGRLERFRGLGLPRGDILEYLPVSQFIPGAESWEQMHVEYDAQTKIRPFKRWAAEKRRGSFEDEDVRRACRSMDSVPEDLRQVVLRVSMGDVA